MTAILLAKSVLEGESPREFLKKLGRTLPLDVNQSVSHGTLNPRDLIHTFLDTLEQHAPREYANLRNDSELEDYLNNTLGGPDEARDFEDSFLHEVLWQEMQAICPPMTFFGSHPGDGSDFGCWAMESGDYEDLAAEGTIDYARQGDEEMAERIRHGQLQGEARYGIIQTGYMDYECYDANGRLLWRS